MLQYYHSTHLHRQDLGAPCAALAGHLLRAHLAHHSAEVDGVLRRGSTIC